MKTIGQHFFLIAAVLHFSETRNCNIMIERPGVNQDSAVQIFYYSMIGTGKMYLKDVPVLVDVSMVGNWWEK